MDTKDFVKDINKLRLANKNKWYYWQGIVNGKQVAIKAFGTWLQVYDIDGINHANTMQASVTDFKAHLLNNVK